MVGRDLLRKISQQILLRSTMQRQAGLIQQQDDIIMALLDLGEFYEEGEEPDEAGRAFRKRHGHAVQAVLNTGAGNRTTIEGSGITGLAFREHYLDLQVVVLRPVFKNLVGDPQ